MCSFCDLNLIISHNCPHVRVVKLWLQQQQNPPVLNWGCQLMRDDLHNGCKTMVVYLISFITSQPLHALAEYHRWLFDFAGSFGKDWRRLSDRTKCNRRSRCSYWRRRLYKTFYSSARCCH